MEVADMQESVSAGAQVNKGRLDAGLNVDHFALVDIAHLTAQTGSLHVQLFQGSVIYNGNAALLTFRHIH
jgi:hypothetical protein